MAEEVSGFLLAAGFDDTEAITECAGRLGCRALRHDAVTDLADDTGFFRVLDRRCKTDAIEPHADLALQECRLCFRPVEAGNAGRGGFRHEALIELGRFNRLLGFSVDLAIDDRLCAVAEHQRGPYGCIGVLEATRHETIGVGGGIGDLFRRRYQFLERFRVFQPLGFEEFFVPVDDPVIHREG